MLDWNAQRQPMVLWGGPAELSAEAMAAIEARLSGGCYCGSLQAELTRRTTARGILTITLQCRQCGSAIGGALKREHHPGCESYPEWDEARRQNYDAQRMQEAQAALAARRTAFEAERRAAFRQRQADYAEWLRTSPQWRELRGRVIARAGYTCEACLVGAAQEVHHLTYARGRLPPAWELRAVCKTCHERLHTAIDEWAGTP